MTTARPNYFVHMISNAATLEDVAQQTIEAACHYAPLATMRSSADLCIDDARKMMNVGRYANALGRATTSLKYSVGIIHEVYQAASDAVTANEEARYLRTQP
jgi:hypothetical protein